MRKEEKELKGYKDGQFYEDISQAPDLGSIFCVNYGDAKGGVRKYHGLSEDKTKLLLIDYVETGSSCFMEDTGDIYFFNKKSGNWYDPVKQEVVTDGA